MSATLPREGQALTNVNLLKDAELVKCPVLLLLAQHSPPWASENTYTLAAALANANLVILSGQGHEAVQSAPDMIVAALRRFFADDRLSPPTAGTGQRAGPRPTVGLVAVERGVGNGEVATPG
ncbi:MAG: alpha/beta hydrolase [Solirubrobacteraceae bacterium]